MPFGDGTGPFGDGPYGVRRAGYCGGYHMPGFLNNYVPRMGYGRGHYFNWWRDEYYHGTPPVYSPSNYLTLSKDEQRRILEEELKELESRKQEIEKKIKELQ